MRSRDGNKTLIRRFIQIILIFLPIITFADEYFISYRYVVKNMALYNESLLISPVMQKCKGEPLLTSLIITKKPKEKKLKKILTLHNEEFMTYLQTIGLDINDRESIFNTISNSTTTLTLRTTCFKVDFNDNFVRLTALKEANK